MSLAYVALGANLADPVAQIAAALVTLTQVPQTRLLRASSLYRTAPVGVHGQPDFINAVAALETSLAPQALLAALFAAALFPLAWRGGAAEKAVVRANGEIVAEVRLTESRNVEVEGPLGVTRIEIAPGRARVAADPGPRQYCVRQGWLKRPGEIAICAPNHVSLQIAGRRNGFDSIAY